MVRSELGCGAHASVGHRDGSATHCEGFLRSGKGNREPGQSVWAKDCRDTFGKPQDFTGSAALSSSRN